MLNMKISRLSDTSHACGFIRGGLNLRRFIAVLVSNYRTFEFTHRLVVIFAHA